MDSWLPILTLILVILIILFIVVTVSLYFTGTIHISGPTGPQGTQGVPGTASNTGATGPRGMVGQMGIQGVQGIQGPTGNIGPTGAVGLSDFAFVSFSQNREDGVFTLNSNENMFFNQADVHGNIQFINNNTLILGTPGFYQVGFGFSNILPDFYVTQSFSLIVNGAAAQPYYTLQEQINLTSPSPVLRYDRGGLSGTVIIQTTSANQTLQLRNTLDHSIGFINETSPVTLGNVGSLTAFMSVIRIF